jgi:hypothetical protein
VRECLLVLECAASECVCDRLKSQCVLFVVCVRVCVCRVFGGERQSCGDRMASKACPVCKVPIQRVNLVYLPDA